MHFTLIKKDGHINIYKANGVEENRWWHKKFSNIKQEQELERKWGFKQHFIQLQPKYETRWI